MTINESKLLVVDSCDLPLSGLRECKILQCPDQKEMVIARALEDNPNIIILNYSKEGLGTQKALQELDPLRGIPVLLLDDLSNLKNKILLNKIQSLLRIGTIKRISKRLLDIVDNTPEFSMSEHT